MFAEINRPEKDLPLLVTLGDPNGLGPELACRLFGKDRNRDTSVVLIGPGESLEWHCRQQGLPPFWREIREGELDSLSSGVYLFQPPGLESLGITPGTPAPEGGKAAGRSLDAACAILAEGRGAGLVTCPLDKAMLRQAGYDFPGHTEYLAHSFGLAEEDVCMHLSAPELRVSLATTHLPLARVPATLTIERILRCLYLTVDFLEKLREEGPIAVCGINPHAGEGGVLGREEESIVEPAVARAKERGMAVEGPLAGDTAFFRALRGEFAAVLAMYHDQGLAPLKAFYFGSAVNVTLGLPVIRTSVDHGTGYDLVGRGSAGTRSLSAAVELAERLGKGQRAGDS